MTPAEHYTAAEEWLGFMKENREKMPDDKAREVIAVAQVHATLATVKEDA